jgi:hypothetical protein
MTLLLFAVNGGESMTPMAARLSCNAASGSGAANLIGKPHETCYRRTDFTLASS